MQPQVPRILPCGMPAGVRRHGPAASEPAQSHPPLACFHPWPATCRLHAAQVFRGRDVSLLYSQLKIFFPDVTGGEERACSPGQVSLPHGVHSSLLYRALRPPRLAIHQAAAMPLAHPHLQWPSLKAAATAASRRLWCAAATLRRPGLSRRSCGRCCRGRGRRMGQTRSTGGRCWAALAADVAGAAPGRLGGEAPACSPQGQAPWCPAVPSPDGLARPTALPAAAPSCGNLFPSWPAETWTAGMQTNHTTCPQRATSACRLSSRPLHPRTDGQWSSCGGCRHMGSEAAAASRQQW